MKKQSALASDSEPICELRQKLATFPYWAVFACFALAGFLAMTVDQPLAYWSVKHGWPVPLKMLLQRCEAFGYSMGAAVILIAVWVLDPARRRLIPRLAMMVFGAGLAANVAKLMLARTRPSVSDFNLGIWDTFHGCLTFGTGGWAWQSFPSAHTATAVALAVGLAVLYPHGRWLFIALAALLGCQRVQSGTHFLSDVCWGGAIGWVVGVGIGRASHSRIGLDAWELRGATPAEASHLAIGAPTTHCVPER